MCINLIRRNIRIYVSEIRDWLFGLSFFPITFFFKKELFLNVLLYPIIMIWILFLLFMFISIGLLIFGISQKKWEFAFAGSVLLLCIGIAILGTGLDLPTGWLLG